MFPSSYDVRSIGATTVYVPVGATLAVFVKPQEGQQSWMVMGVSGAPEILPCGIGATIPNNPTTLTQANLIAFNGLGFPLVLGGSPLEIKGPAYFYLSARGATSLVGLLALKGPGF